MIRANIPAFSGLLMALLAGCGASSTDTGNSTNPTGLTISEPVTILGLVDASEVLTDRVTTLEATLEPQSGTALYRGVVVIAEDLTADGGGAMGAVSFDVDFGAQTITGSADDFFEVLVDEEGDVTTGLSSTDGQFDFSATDTEGFIALDVTGSITLEGASHVVDGTVSGGFLGEDGATADMFIAEGANVTVTSSGSGVTGLDFAIIAD